MGIQGSIYDTNISLVYMEQTNLYITDIYRINLDDWITIFKQIIFQSTLCYINSNVISNLCLFVLSRETKICYKNTLLFSGNQLFGIWSSLIRIQRICKKKNNNLKGRTMKSNDSIYSVKA